MTAKRPFMPHYGTNQVLTAAAGSLSAAIDPNDEQVRITNTGANKAYVRTYNSANGTQSATIADLNVAPGQTTTITKGVNHNALAYISAAGTGLEVITGEGW